MVQSFRTKSRFAPTILAWIRDKQRVELAIAGTLHERHDAVERVRLDLSPRLIPEGPSPTPTNPVRQGGGRAVVALLLNET